MKYTILTEQNRLISAQWKAVGFGTFAACAVGTYLWHRSRSGKLSRQQELDLMLLQHLRNGDVKGVASDISCGADVNCFDRLPLLYLASLPLSATTADMFTLLLAHGAEARIAHSSHGLSTFQHVLLVLANGYTCLPQGVLNTVRTSGWIPGSARFANLPITRFIQRCQEKRCSQLRNEDYAANMRKALRAVIDTSCHRQDASTTTQGGDAFTMAAIHFEINQTDSVFSTKKGVGTALMLCCDGEVASEQFTAATVPILLTHDEIEVNLRRGEAVVYSPEKATAAEKDGSYDLLSNAARHQKTAAMTVGPCSGDGMTALQMLCSRVAHSRDPTAIVGVIKALIPLAKCVAGNGAGDFTGLSSAKADLSSFGINTPDASGHTALFHLLAPLLCGPPAGHIWHIDGTAISGGATGSASSPMMSRSGSKSSLGDPTPAALANIGAENLRRVVEVAHWLVDAGCWTEKHVVHKQLGNDKAPASTEDTPVALAQRLLAAAERHVEFAAHVIAPARELCVVLAQGTEYNVVQR